MDASVAAIGGLKQLTSLNLSGSSITDAALACLPFLTLRQLKLPAACATAAFASVLCAWPNVEVEFSSGGSVRQLDTTALPVDLPWTHRISFQRAKLLWLQRETDRLERILERLGVSYAY